MLNYIKWSYILIIPLYVLVEILSVFADDYEFEINPYSYEGIGMIIGAPFAVPFLLILSILYSLLIVFKCIKTVINKLKDGIF